MGELDFVGGECDNVCIDICDLWDDHPSIDTVSGQNENDNRCNRKGNKVSTNGNYFCAKLF